MSSFGRAAVVVIVVALLAPAAEVPIASAATTASGDVTLLSTPPVSVQDCRTTGIDSSPNTSCLPSDRSQNSIFAFRERSAATIATGGLRVDVGPYSPGYAAGTWLSTEAQVLGPPDQGYVIPAGERVNSYFLHSDLPFADTGVPYALRTGTISFDDAILGVAIRDSRIAATDVLASPTTFYPLTTYQRGLEFDCTTVSAFTGDTCTPAFNDNADAIRFTDDHTLEVKMSVGSRLDQIRVITDADEPTQTTCPTPVHVNEGSQATVAARAFSDADAFANVAISADLGSIQQSGSSAGSWSWSHTPTDGPAQSATVTVTALDRGRYAQTCSFGLVVDNVAPTATFIAPRTPTSGTRSRCRSRTRSTRRSPTQQPASPTSSTAATARSWPGRRAPRRRVRSRRSSAGSRTRTAGTPIPLES